jgi:hypothetical protein
VARLPVCTWGRARSYLPSVEPNKRSLPPELVSLVHHIELSEAHWWERAVQRFLIAAVASTGAIHRLELPPVVLREYGIELSNDAVAEHTAVLIADDDFVELPDGRVKLSESSASQVAEDVARGREQRARLEGRFVEALVSEGADVDPEKAWNDFESKLLTPLVQELGARTYELILPAREGAEPELTLQALIGRANEEFGEEFRRAVIAFLDPADPDVRDYVLQMLNAYFFAQAAALDRVTLQALDDAREDGSQVRLFLDTNFLFSILRLHDNPQNELAEALDDLIGRVRDQVAVRFYVLPITVDEARRVLDGHAGYLRGVRPSPRIAAVVAETRPELSGLTRRYLRAAAESNQALAADEFFEPYREALLEIIRAAGVELFNENIDSLRGSQQVIDDILEEEDWLKDHARTGREPKTYARIEHDMLLYHFVRAKRPPAVDSPLEVGAWMVTEDLRMVGFDRWKRGKRHEFPVALTPASLMQLLQFWVPRSEELDRALIGAIRLPFLFEGFDREAESVTIRIIRTLSRYENQDDLRASTVQAVLMNRALRQRLRRQDAKVNEEAALRDAFAERAAELETTVETLKEDSHASLAQLHEREAALEEARNAQASLQRHLEEHAAQTARELAQAREELEKERAQRMEAQSRAAEDSATTHRQHRDALQSKAQARYWSGVAAGIAAAVLVATGMVLLLREITLDPLVEWASLGAVASLAGLVVATWLAKPSDPDLPENWLPARILESTRARLLTVVGGVVVGALGNDLYTRLA